MTLPSRLPCIRRDAKCPISIRPPHQSAEIYALSSGVFHFNESGTLGVWRAVEDNIDVIHWGTPRYYCPARPYCESAWAVADFVPWRRPVSVWPTFRPKEWLYPAHNPLAFDWRVHAMRPTHTEGRRSDPFAQP